MQGLHLTADLSACQSPEELLCDPLCLRQYCLDLVEAAGLSAVADRFHRFPDFEGKPGGVTGMVLLAESHLALHTWPEQGAVTLDVYVCNFSTDNSAKAESLLQALIKLFGPQGIVRQQIQRGEAQFRSPSEEPSARWAMSNSIAIAVMVINSAGSCIVSKVPTNSSRSLKAPSLETSFDSTATT